MEKKGETSPFIKVIKSLPFEEHLIGSNLLYSQRETQIIWFALFFLPPFLSSHNFLIKIIKMLSQKDSKVVWKEKRKKEGGREGKKNTPPTQGRASRCPSVLNYFTFLLLALKLKFKCQGHVLAPFVMFASFMHLVSKCLCSQTVFTAIIMEVQCQFNLMSCLILMLIYFDKTLS